MSKFDRRNFIKKTSLTAAFASSYVYSSENLRKNEISDQISNNLLEGEYINFKNKYHYGTSITLDVPNLAIQNALPKNNFYIKSQLFNKLHLSLKSLNKSSSESNFEIIDL